MAPPPERNREVPFIRVENWPEDTLGERKRFPHQPIKLLEDLRKACVAAKVPDIEDKSLVTVVLGGRQYLLDDKTLVIIVEGLLDKPARTRKTRYDLAVHLANAAREHLPENWKIEVLVKPFDESKNTYYVLGPDN